MNLLSTNQNGRSMIEMLGVLSIVGILSVGGIAAYSKAMYKYQLNKMADEYILFIQDILQYRDEFIRLKKRNGDGAYAIADYIKKIGLLPRGWSVKDNLVYDTKQNRFRPFIRGSNSIDNNKLVFDYSIKKESDDKENFEICKFMLLNVSLQFQDFIYNTWICKQDNCMNGSYYYGNNHCTGANRTCLSDVNIKDVVTACRECAGDKSCLLVLTF